MKIEDQLRTARWGLQFVVPEAEEGYRRWHQLVGIPFTRAGMGLSLVNWLMLIATQVWLFRPGMGPQIAVEAGVIMPLIAVTLLTTYLPRWIGWTLPLVATANAAAGLQGVWLGLSPGLRLDYSVIAAITIGFFGFAIFRLPPLRAALAVGSYYLFATAVIAWAVTSGNCEASTATWYALGLVISFFSAFAACLLISRLSRETYAQERVITAQRLDIERERDRADRLLTSILPTSIAEQLKDSPKMIAAHHDEVTVLFADIVGFTPMAAALSANELVERLNEIFTSFDALAATLGAEKIKTIGDAYMAVAGAPVARADHAKVIAELALGMQQVVQKLAARHPISIRIGVSTGPAVAGVIGSGKFAYDLWGDTVNTAARMESHGVAGSIHVTEATRARLDGLYVFEDRGTIEIKGKGPMRTWLLTGRITSPA